MLCPACGLVLSPEAFPRNRTGPCKVCHNTASREAYRQRKALKVAQVVLAAEECVWQLWGVHCMLCGWEAEVRRRATEEPLRLWVDSLQCRRCDASCFAALMSGPATLGAAAAEIERVTRLLR